MTTNPRSPAVQVDEDGNLIRLICEMHVDWVAREDLYVDYEGHTWDICWPCGIREYGLVLPDIEVYEGSSRQPRFDWVTFDASKPAGQVPCAECGGSGWWGFGPTIGTTGPCVQCKGTGRMWVALW